MHETGIAQSILDIAIKTALEKGAKKINNVAVKVGKMSAIDEASLRFAFDALKAETIAENATFEYIDIPLTGKCEDCGYESELEGYFVLCPKCSSGRVSILTGNELEIAYIDVDYLG